MTEPSYADICRAVAVAFVAAFPQFIAGRLEQSGADLSSVSAEADAGVRQGLQWLRGELEQWAAMPAERQGRGPLQIFQAAAAFPTAALETAGAVPVVRDEAAADALPGDLYGLAPASSRDIGGDAWRAHIAWGIAKAKLVADAVPDEGPRSVIAVAVVTMDPADRAAIHLVASERGVPVRHWRNPGAVAAGLDDEVPRWGAVDLGHAAAEEAVRRLAAAGVKVAAYGPDPDDIAMARWLALGAATVVARQQLIPVLESWLPVQA